MFHSLFRDGAGHWSRCECNSVRKATPTGHPTFEAATKCAENELRSIAAAHKAAAKARVAVNGSLVCAYVMDDEGFLYSSTGSGRIVGWLPIDWNKPGMEIA